MATEKTNVLDGWKKLLTTFGGGGMLGLDIIPEKLVWPFVAVLGCYLIGQSLADAAKQLKLGGK